MRKTSNKSADLKLKCFSSTFVLYLVRKGLKLLSHNNYSPHRSDERANESTPHIPIYRFDIY